jgi:hypothetical protein
MRDQVGVLHDLQGVFEMNSQGGHCTTLGGNSRKIAGQVIFPSLHKQPKATSHTVLTFEFTTAAAAVRWKTALAVSCGRRNGQQWTNTSGDDDDE